MNSVEPIASKAKSGIWGLDNILSGGFSRGHVFLRGVPVYVGEGQPLLRERSA
jgi:hypothetical protein